MSRRTGLEEYMLRSARVLIAVPLLIWDRPAQAQTLSFFREFTTPQIDQAFSVAADASGIYVIGNRAGSQAGQNSAGLRKYDSRGNELWTREFSALGPGIILIKAAAAAGGVYVFGYTSEGGRSIVRKYNADGNEVWTRQLEFSVPGDIATDGSGVYVAGRDFPPNHSYLRKYSPDGAEIWTTRFGDPTSLQNPHNLAVDGTGIYLFGIGMGGSFLRKYDLRGNELWTHPLGNAGPNVNNVAAADPTGFYAIRGFSLVKYDAEGNELWSRQIASSVSGVGVAADATSVYVVGNTGLAALPGQCRSGSGGDFFVRKYDVAGTEQWTREFGTSEATRASGFGVALDTSGVYVVGEEGSAQIQDELEEIDAFGPTKTTRSAFLARFEKAAAVVIGSGPRIFPDCVVNAASYVGGGVAPGEIVTIFGSAMGPSELTRLRVSEDQRLATQLAETRVLFNGVAAPLVYVSDKQSSAIVPYGVAGQTSVDVQVEYKGVRSEAVTVPVLTSRPGIFSLNGSGQGQGAILNEDGSVNSAANPAQRGSILSLFGTGGGEAVAGIVDGQIVRDAVPRTNLPVSVVFDLGLADFGIASKQAEVLYAGGVPGSIAGLLQVNFRVPANESAGNAMPITLFIGPHWTVFEVTIAIR